MTQGEDAGTKDKDGERWKLVSKITGCKNKPKQKMIKGDYREIGINSLYAHFQNLLSKE